MAINIPMDELLKVIDVRDPDNPIDLNGFSVGDCVWRKPYTVTFPTKPAEVSIVSVKRDATESTCEQTTAILVLNGGTVLYGDTITITASPATGYNNPLIKSIQGVDIIDPDAAPHTGKVTGDVSFQVLPGLVKNFSVSYIAMPTGVASFKIYAQEPGLSSSVYVSNPTEPGSFSVPYGTKVYAIATAATGYNNPTVTGVSGSPTEVTSNISVYVTAGTVKAYTLSISTIEGVASQTITRTSSPLKGAATGALSNGATVYYGDVLSLSATADDKYGLPTVTSPVTIDTTMVDSNNNINTSQFITAGDYKKYTVTIVSSNTTYGTVDTSSFIVGHGTILRSNDTSDSGSEIQVVGLTSIWVPPAGANPGYWTTVPDLSIVATASTVESAAIDGTFEGWTVGSTQKTTFSHTVTDNITITARFSGKTKTYTVTINRNNTSYGTVSASYAADIPYGTAISASGSTLTIGTGTVTATPSSTTAQYTYGFNNWTGIPSGGKVTGNVTVTANFTATVRNYTVSYPAMPTGVSSFTIYYEGSDEVTHKIENPTSAGSVTIPYGTLIWMDASASTGYNSPNLSTSIGLLGDSYDSATAIYSNINVTLTAGSSTSADVTIDVTFPAVVRGSAYTVIQTDEGYYYESSAITTYEGYSYPTCVIDGITVGSTYTQISQTSLLNTITRSASFSNGVLRVRTTVGTTQETNTIEPIMTAGTYSTTATFSS